MHFYSFLQQSEATGTYTKERAVQLQETIFFAGQQSISLPQGRRHAHWLNGSDRLWKRILQVQATMTLCILFSQRSHSASAPTGWPELHFSACYSESSPFRKSRWCRTRVPPSQCWKQGLRHGREPILIAVMRSRWDAELRLGISWLVLKHCQQILHLAQILICLKITKAAQSKYSYPSIKSFKILYVRGVREGLGVDLLRGQLRWLN